MKRALAVMGLALFLLAGCSTKMSYYFLDWAIEWELDDYVDLNRDQQKQFDAVLDEFIDWHRREELPRYVAQLESIKQQMLSGTLTPAAWAEEVNYAQSHWFRLFEHVFEGILPIVQSLSDEQVSGIIEQLRKEEAKLVAEYAGKTQEELIADSDERLTERAEKWIGKLSDKQKAMIHASNTSRLSTLDMWLEYRHEWLRQFETALNQRADTPLLRSRLQLLMTAPQTLKSEKHQQAVRENSENFGRLVMSIYRDLSDKQSKKLWHEYDALTKDLAELANEPD
ncbi:DUF6279 family lipoprotein [Shewanella zhangzhouensis]|uniref:DUF6279 family lipoprotein n=1 Tax=Shewanella zhangzhouensis TaxID=2864213 RepID=UPI001C65515B|nr:DUF6279 family lipoprotein [Shewanella zhangzhouensis]QYK06705.1 hypothetical protein K0H63_07795 [Shewanella zhangzhouensis]